MDLGTIRGAGTAVLLVSFVALCIWAWLPAQKRGFDEASRLPFLDEEGGRAPSDRDRRKAR